MQQEKLANNLLEEVTKDWKKADFEETNRDDLRYHISEFLETNPKSGSDLFLLKFEFEKYMGW